MVILSISTIVLATGVMTFFLFDELEGVGAFLVLASIVIGFGLCGLTLTVEQTEETYPAKIMCSSELGECRIITEIKTFTTISYTEVNKLLTTPMDSVKVITCFNSYGGVISRELVLTQIPEK
jgi:hypothetical protein